MNDNANLVQNMELLLVRVETTRKSVAQKDMEIHKLRMDQERRAALPTSRRESAAAQKLAAEVQAREADLRELEHSIAEKQQTRDQLQRRMEQTQSASAGFDAGLDESRIEATRRENMSLDRKIRAMMKKIELTQAQHQTMEGRIAEKARQAEAARRRAEENQRTEQDFAAQLRDLDVLKQQHAEKENVLNELNDIVEEMDEALESMDRAVETAKLEREVAITAIHHASEDAKAQDEEFERSPQLRLWLGSSSSAIATTKAMNLGTRRGQKWITEVQIRQAQQDIARRLAESDAVKAKLNQRMFSLQRDLDETKARLKAKLTEREKNAHLCKELQRSLDDPDGIVAELEEKIPKWKAKRVEAESRAREVTDEWNRVDAAARQKYEKAQQALDDQLALLKWEEAETEKVSQKVREAKKREKALLFKQLQQEADQLEAEDDMDPALVELMAGRR